MNRSIRRASVFVIFAMMCPGAASAQVAPVAQARTTFAEAVVSALPCGVDTDSASDAAPNLDPWFSTIQASAVCAAGAMGIARQNSTTDAASAQIDLFTQISGGGTTSLTEFHSRGESRYEYVFDVVGRVRYNTTFFMDQDFVVRATTAVCSMTLIGPEGPVFANSFLREDPRGQMNVSRTGLLVPGRYTLRAMVAREEAGTNVLGGYSSMSTIQGSMSFVLPNCTADWNVSGAVSVQDVFDFLQDYFGGTADYNGDGLTSVQDLYDFLAGYFVSC